MPFSLASFLLNLDNFGHKVELNYKGSETHKSHLGGLCSFCVKVMTLIMAVVALKSMILMEDPEVVSFSRPLSKDEIKQNTQVSFEDYGYLLGVMTLINGWPADIPPEVGSLKAKVVMFDHELKTHTYLLELKDCKDFLEEETFKKDDMNVFANSSIDGGFLKCVDPADMIISGFNDYS